MKGVLNSYRDSWEDLLFRVDPRRRHALGEIQGREEFFFRRRHRELISDILNLSSPAKWGVEKNREGEVLVFDPDPPTGNRTEEVERIIRKMVPWRKGRYRFFSHPIDSEWDSSIKWNHLLPLLRNLLPREATVADLGCNNGYFLFRLLCDPEIASPPGLVVGFEPVHRNALQYLLLNSAARLSQAVFLLLGYEALRYFPGTFDVILCLGILYHHPDPLGILQRIHQALKPEGRVVIDCQGIPGEEPLILFPQRRYTGKRNFWFLPTTAALRHWLERLQFRDIEIWGEYPLGAEEQKTTALASGDSLAEGLADPDIYYSGNFSQARTVEGYPPPVRIYLSASKTMSKQFSEELV